MTKAAYTVRETLREIGIGRTKLYREIAEGRLKARKIGKKTIFLAGDIQDYLDGLPELNQAA